jgi:tetratricopeptide (TPR) repeat protein
MEPTAVSPLSNRRLRRRWRVPPAIMHGPEPLESAGILDELSGAAGLVLWQSLRDVTLWAGTPPAGREGLFSACAERKRIAAILTAGLDPELEQPLGMITAMVGHPGRVSAQRVALACRQVAQWAEGRGKLATALAFAQAGAVACPGDASAGYKVGQLARRRAEYVRAETWFRRTIALARQEGDWASYALSFSGLGNLHLQRGNLPKARALHTRALRAATRHSLRNIQGDALHDLFVLAGTAGEAGDALQFARQAFEVFGVAHPKIPVLAQDLAFYWLLQGHFEPSLRVFQSLRPHMGRTIERIVLLPNIARAAGGAGVRGAFEEVWVELQSILEAEPNDRSPEALLELARGAASLKDWDRAETAATRAIESARGRGEARVEFEGEAVLQAILLERSVQEGTSPTNEAQYAEYIDSFAGKVVESLNSCVAVS